MNLSSIAFITLLIHFSMVCEASDIPATISTFPKGDVIPSSQILEAVCADWVEVSTNKASVVHLWDVALEIDPESRVLIGANSVFFYALTLNGKTQVGNQKAPAGKIMVWSHYRDNGGKAVIYTYSAQRLATVFGAKGFSEDPTLTALAKSQKRKRFWGLLRPTGVNVAAPVETSIEESRVFYQTNPSMIGVKRASQKRADYPQNTVATFLDALANDDVVTVGALLSPTLFLEGASESQLETLLIQERQAFATHLINSGKYSKYKDATFEDIGESKFTATSGNHSLVISLIQFDDGLFVTSLTSK